MRIVIGRGRNRNSWDIPRDARERDKMTDELIHILFKGR